MLVILEFCYKNLDYEEFKFDDFDKEVLASSLSFKWVSFLLDTNGVAAVSLLVFNTFLIFSYYIFLTLTTSSMKH